MKSMQRLCQALHPPLKMPLVTILVEDNKPICDTLVPALEETANAQVVAIAKTSTGAAQALARWRGKWHLLVVDLHLGQGSGLDVLQAVGPRSSDQHVLVLTNHATPEMRARCLALGADAVFDKLTELQAFFDHCTQLPEVVV